MAHTSKGKPRRPEAHGSDAPHPNGVPPEQCARAWARVNEAWPRGTGSPATATVFPEERLDGLEGALRTHGNGAFLDGVRLQKGAGPRLQRTLDHALLSGPHTAAGCAAARE